MRKVSSETSTASFKENSSVVPMGPLIIQLKQYKKWPFSGK